MACLASGCPPLHKSETVPPLGGSAHCQAMHTCLTVHILCAMKPITIVSSAHMRHMQEKSSESILASLKNHDASENRLIPLPNLSYTVCHKPMNEVSNHAAY